MLNGMKRVVAGAGLLVGLSATAQAQYLTDAGSPLGSGGGVVGGVVNYGGFAGVSPASSGGYSVEVPGGSVIVSQNTFNVLFETMTAGGASNISALAAEFGGGAAGQALAEAFGAFGGLVPTAANARAALIAFNAAIDAGSGPVPPGLAAARSALIGFGAKPQ